MIKTNRILLLSCLAGAFLAGCQEPPPPPTIVAPTPVIPPAPTPLPTRVPGPAVPAVPAQLPKPKLVGPTAPSIVVLPAHIAEPMIRVKLTDELSYRPVI